MTAADLSALKENVAHQAATPIKTGNGPKTIEEYITIYKPELTRALSKNIDVERFTRMALTTIRGNKKLRECTPLSLMAALMQAAQLNLEPGPLGYCYLIPYENKKAKVTEAQFQIGYKGMLALARRSGELQSIAVHEVREKDYFELEWGLEDKLVHKPNLKEDRGEPWLYYLVAHFTNGGYYIHTMTLKDIERHRNKSQAYKNDNYKSTPWNTDPEAMALKTVIKAAWKYLPVATEEQRLVEATDGTVKHEISDDMTEVPADIIDGEWASDPEETIENDRTEA